MKHHRSAHSQGVLGVSWAGEYADKIAAAAVKCGGACRGRRLLGNYPRAPQLPHIILHESQFEVFGSEREITVRREEGQVFGGGASRPLGKKGNPLFNIGHFCILPLRIKFIFGLRAWTRARKTALPKNGIGIITTRVMVIV